MGFDPSSIDGKWSQVPLCSRLSLSAEYQTNCLSRFRSRGHSRRRGRDPKELRTAIDDGDCVGSGESGNLSRCICAVQLWEDTMAKGMPASRLILGLAGAMTLFTGAALANDDLAKLQQDPKQWVMPLGNYSSQRYSALDQITNKNVKDLQVAWTFSTGVLRGHEGGPLVVGNMMYVHAPFPNTVFALDLSKGGQIVWKYEPKQDPNVIPVMCCDTVNRGVAYGDGMIFLHQADTNLVALDAKTGKEVWKVADGDPAKGETGTSAPMVIKDKVLVGTSGGEFGVRGHVTAYDIKTGKQVWRGFSMGPDADTLMDPDKTTELGKPV